MKRTFKIILASTLLVAVFSGCLFILTYKASTKLEVLSIPYDYYVEEDDDKNISIPIFLNEEYSPYMEKDNINKVYLKSSNDESCYKVELSTINALDSAYYNDKEYYMYDLTINLPFKESSDIKVSDAYLDLEYENDEISIHIGNIYIYNNNDKGAMNYSSLKGLTTEINNTTMLQAVMVKLNTKVECIINNIYPISFNAGIIGEKIIKCDEDNAEEVLNNFSTSDIFSKKSTMAKDIIINQDNYLIIPLCYEQIGNSSTIGFVIQYETNGQSYNLIIKPFKFFDELSGNVEKVEYEYSF